MPGGRGAEIRGREPAPARGQLELGVRPEHLTSSIRATPAAAFAGRVAIIEHLGNSTILYVDTPAGQLIVEGEGDLDVKAGETRRP